MEVVSYKGQVVENDNNLLSWLPEVESLNFSLFIYFKDWRGLDHNVCRIFKMHLINMSKCVYAAAMLNLLISVTLFV